MVCVGGWACCSPNVQRLGPVCDAWELAHLRAGVAHGANVCAVSSQQPARRRWELRVGRKTARGWWKGQQWSVSQRDQWFECQAGSRGPSALGLWITGRSPASRLASGTLGCLYLWVTIVF